MARKPKDTDGIESEVTDDPEPEVTDLSTLKYKGHVRVIADLPAVTQHRLMLRGFKHVLGNEAASKVTAWKKGEDGATAAEADVAAKLAEVVNEMLVKIDNGTLGSREGYTRGTAVETVMRQIAVAELVARMVKQGGKWPKKATDTVKVGDRVLARTALTDEYVEKHGARLRRDAEAQIAADAARAAAAADSIGDDGDLLA